MSALRFRRVAFAGALALLVGACTPSTQAPDDDPTLQARVGQVVDLQGEYGFGKAGHFVKVDGEPVYIEGEKHSHVPFEVGQVVRLRGTLQHTGPLPLPAGCKPGDPCPVAAGSEHFFVTDAVVEPWGQ